MSCFPGSGNDARTITLIEPDDLVLTATSSGSSDQSLDERGEVLLTEDVNVNNQGVIKVTFLTPKAGEYRFEYLYVDALSGEPHIGEIGYTHPGAINVVPVTQTAYGFTVNLAGVPIAPGYMLRWRVVVVHISGQPGTGIDTPERFRVNLPQANICTIQFVNPRSSTDYGFSELRVENVDDDPDIQTIINVQVVGKTQTDFTVGLNPSPSNVHYYLVGRTP